MNHHRWLLLSVGGSRVLDEADQRESVERNPVVRPGSVVVLVHSLHCPPSLQSPLLLLHRWGADQLEAEGAEGVDGEDVLPHGGHVDLPVVAGARLRLCSKTIRQNRFCVLCIGPWVAM